MSWLARHVRRCPRTGRIVGFHGGWWLYPLYPILGFLALLWFVFRVSAKPSRAAYPCQQASLALGTGFVVWLLGTLGILAFFRWVRRRLRGWRRAAVLASLVSIGVLSIWTLLGLPHPLASAWTPVDPPNSPMGVPKGIHPGRVVWIRDPQATLWDGSTGN